MPNFEQFSAEFSRNFSDESIRNLNKELVDLAIKSFSIERDKNSSSAIVYRIVRSEKGKEENTFRTLNEGEKMIISFLYFIELCKGKQNEADTNQNKIIIIDNPISSLSHICIRYCTNYKKNFYK